MFPPFDGHDLCLGGVWRDWNGWVWWCWYFHSGWVEWIPATRHLLRAVQFEHCNYINMPERLLAELHEHFGVPLEEPYHVYQEQLRYDRDIVKSAWYYQTLPSYSNLDAGSSELEWWVWGGEYF